MRSLDDRLRRGARIMVIDDEPANLKLIDRLLRQQGFSAIEQVQDPRQIAQRYAAAVPDLVLLDLNMPHIDGFQVLELLHQLDPHLPPPVLVLTAQQGQEALVRALDSGARDFVSKPFDRVELLARVSNLLELRFSHLNLFQRKQCLENEVRERTRDLRRTQLDVLRRLGRAAEYRDNETGFHILRMSHYSEVLARRRGWDEARCELLLHASPLHDIGKIGIPDCVLLKRGKLDAAEWALMREHPAIGARILEGGESELLAMGARVALSHHERWDGSGYPLGLTGEAIPEEGRIVAVADVFDALTTARPYKPAWPEAEALAYLQANRGSHFEPAAVDDFFAIIEQIRAIRHHYQEPEDSAPHLEAFNQSLLWAGERSCG